jgi:hypothetical protein
MKPERIDPVDRARIAWRGAVAAAALNLLGMPLELVVGHSVAGMPRLPGLASMALAAALLVILFRRRSDCPVPLASFAFTVNTFAILAALWSASAFWVNVPGHFSPFQAHRLGALTVALLAPEELWVGVVSIVAYIGSAFTQYSLFTPAVRATLPPTEPLALLAYGLFAIALLAYRLRGLAALRQMARVRAEADALERLARMSLAVRDLSNTPLQVIAANAEIIRMRAPELMPVVERIERALAQLQEAAHMLASHESQVKWRPGDESFDPKELLLRH